MDNMRFVILTPYKRLLDISGVDEICIPTELGIIGVLYGHAPMVTAIKTGVVWYTRSSEHNISSFYKVAGGVAEITSTSVTLLVDVGEEAAEIDLARAKRAFERAEGRLAAKELGNIEVKRAESAKDRAMARIQAAELHASKNTKAAQGK